MAELLIAEGYSPPDHLAVRLREDLPAEYVVVVGAQIHGQTCDAIVVAPQGLLVLHYDETQPARSREAEEDGTAYDIRARHFSDTVRSCDRAITAFLTDEFPSLNPEIQHVAVYDEAVDAGKSSDRLGTSSVVVDRLGEADRAVDWSSEEAFASEELQSTLAQALCERRLTARQRATAPFIFRSSGRFARGHQAWTIQEVIAHADRDPDAAQYHLRNGTLVQWFGEQGATHMVRYCDEALHTPTGDYRAVLEDFLLRTGLVEKPRFLVRPRVIDLGAVAAGDSATAPMSVTKGRGRGYLFGSLRSTQSWLQIEPRRFVDGEYDGAISVNTASLALRSQPYTTTVEMTSSATEDPYSIPVRIRVAPAFTVAAQRIGQVLILALVTGAMGLFAGWLWGTYALPDSVARSQIVANQWVPMFSMPRGWALMAGQLWALVGALHVIKADARQFAGWGILRWAGHLAAWSAAMFLLAGGPVWLLDQFWADATTLGFSRSALAAGLTGVVIAIVPAAVTDVPSRRRRRAGNRDDGIDSQRRRRRLLNLGIAGFAALFVFMVASRWPYVEPSVTRAEGWLTQRAGVLDERLDEWTDAMTLRYYDRRAPAQPTLVPAATPHPGSEDDTDAVNQP